jgi:mediator of RNA polymerase II transcription subunit 23
MASLVERWSGGASPPTNKVAMPGTGSLMAVGITEPCPLELLNSLTTYAKMSLWNNVLSRVLKPSAGHGHLCLSPALVETYSRLIVYMEMDYGLALKTFLGQAFPNVWRQNNKPTAHTFLELLTYRLQRHIQPHYRLQLLGILYQLSGGGFGSNYQLQLSIESTALRLLVGLGSNDLLTQMAKVTGDARLQNISQLLSPDSEELNRLFVLVLARSIRIGCLDNPSGGWVENTVRQTQNTTSHSWPQHVLNCMPESIRACYRDQPTMNSISRPEDKQALLNTVDEEWRKWTSMASGPSQDVVSYFTQEGGSPTYLCLLLKMLLDQGKIPPLAYGVLETLSAKAFSTQIRTLLDYVVAFILAMRNDPTNQRMFINRAVAALNELVWKYNVIPHDRLVLCMALRHYDPGDLSVLLVIIHVLLTRTREFKDRVTAFLAENSPEYWRQSDWHQKHITFHQNYPELIYFEGVQDRAAHTQKTYLPVYYGNVCLRFLPVFDIFTHRLIELLPQTVKSFEQLLDAFGGLYKFHDRPITHLYHTLHYYHNILADKTAIKKKLVGTVLGKNPSERPSGWCLSQSYLNYLTSDAEPQWVPDLIYFSGLVNRLVEMIDGYMPPQFSKGDWRFLELPTPSLHMLYSASVELLSLPDFTGAAVGQSLLELVSSRQVVVVAYGG